MQLITYYQMAFKQEKVPVWLYTYRILSTSKTTGIIQLIPNAISLDGLKKEPTYPGSLKAYFDMTYGIPYGATRDYEPPALKVAIEEYVKSMAGYSIIAYLLAIKDRYYFYCILFAIIIVELVLDTMETS
jgi:phosphatidylinositol 4-kinase